MSSTPILALALCAAAATASYGRCARRRTNALATFKEGRYETMRALEQAKRSSAAPPDGTALWYLLQPDYSCEDTALVGHHFDDGAKYICNLHWLHRQRRPCVYYSFGVNGEIEFEAELVDLLPTCEMHAFDPTPSVRTGPSAKRLGDMGVHYHAWGLAGDNGTIELEATAVEAMTLGAVRERLGHLDAPIDILKVDIEGHEWAAFDEMLRHCERDRPAAMQILVELHMYTVRGDGGIVHFTELRRKLERLSDSLHRCGYRCFSKDPNHYCHLCLEYGFVHERFLQCQ